MCFNTCLSNNSPGSKSKVAKRLESYTGILQAATGVEGRPMPIQEATTTEGETYDDSQMQLPFGRSGAFHEEVRLLLYTYCTKT